MSSASPSNAESGARIAIRPSRKGRRGIALILVLVFLVLITALVMAFFSSVTTELSGAKGYASGSNAKELANSAAQAVIGAIRQGTSGGTTVAWASQPGMIRTYNNSGAPVAYYKLYSSDNMVVSSFPFNPDSDVDPAWSTKTALFTDLNSPVISGTSAIFPILDGNSIKPLTQTASGTVVPSYLGYSTSGTSPDIDGFAITTGTSSLVSGTLPASYSPGSPLSTTNTPVPMPVKWIYVLKDGTLTAPTGVDSTGKVALWSGTGTATTNPIPSTTNPIVGRIAFWTDDDTCKINVNTASEGNFSDTPKAQGVTDFNIANYPVAQNEYQRYPGHPAMTCLSPVLGSLFPVDHTLDASGSGYTPTKPAAYAPYQPYFDMAPRLNVDTVGNQGSKAGTVVTSTNTGLSALQVKSDRMYASVDDFLFQPGSTSGTSRPFNPPTSTSGTLTTSLMQKAKFFLTADSRAPDVNLFNQPRIVTWPVSATSGTTYRTIFDSAIAFCGEIGTNGTNPYQYYFQRQRNDHPTNDLPAPTSNLAVTSSTNGLYRNRMIYQYLQYLTSQNIPGFGGNFFSKYPAPAAPSTGPVERDQILTEIFDFIRCLNLDDTSNGSTTFHPFAPIASGTSPYNYPTAYAGNSSSLTQYAGYGQVVPIYDTVTNTKGFGRFPTVAEASIIFIATGWNDGRGGLATDTNYEGVTTGTNTYTTGSLAGTLAPGGYYCSGTNAILGTPTSNTHPPFYTIEPAGTALPIISDSNIQMQAALLLSFFDPSQGEIGENGTYSVQVIGLNNFNWGPTSTTGTSMGFPYTSGSDVSNMCVSGAGKTPQYAVFWGGNLGFRSFMATDQAGQAAGSLQYYPFVSGVKNFPYSPSTPGSPGTFYFSGGQITINILLPTNTPGWPLTSGTWPLANSQLPTRPPIQQLTLSFPAATLPLATYAPSAPNNQTTLTPRQDRGNFNYRFGYCNSNYGANAAFICGPNTSIAGNTGTDVVRSVRAYPGDIRMIAGILSGSDTATNPAPSPGYFDSTETEIPNSGLSNWNYGSVAISSTVYLVHSLRESVDYPFYGAILGKLVGGDNYANSVVPAAINGPPNAADDLNIFSGAGNNATVDGAFILGGTSGLPGDWDNGFGYTADGPYIGKPDEGNFSYTGGVPYFGASNYSYVAAGQTFYSPNRMMPSPVQFGSLPTGVSRNHPWQTLLFCPDPAAIVSQSGANVHPGFGTGADNGLNTLPPYLPPFTSPPDHLLLDLFNMPVVEPYPITEPLSTAGRINMNYQIAPFTYIERNTGLRAVLKAERMTVIPDSAGTSYKNGSGTAFKVNTVTNGFSVNYDYRVPINADQTLMAFDNYFANNQDIFRSTSQICDMFLYPARDADLSTTSGPTWDNQNINITNFWLTHRLTGDNSRERPYATIYPRLTTKSNTFTIHMRVQCLKKVSATSATTWNDTQDVVISEYRGSETVERYVDPSDPGLPDFANVTASNYVPTALDAFYKFRVTNSQQFAP